MSMRLLIITVLFLSLASSTPIIDSKIADANVLIPCPIDRTQWTFPSILQWYRANTNFTKPVASQFDNYPVHIDDFYRHTYSLHSNGSLNIANVQLNDNDTFECRLILIDRGLLDVKDKYFITLRVNEPPRFLNRSNSLQISAPHSTVHFICRIYGVPHPTVTWYRQRDTDLELLSIDNQELTLHNVDDRVAGKYRCVGKNQLATVDNDFQLLIRGSIYWRRFPESQTVRLNDSIVLRCEGESSEPLQYQWLKDDLPISDIVSTQDRIRTYSDGVLSINRIEPSDHGSYVCLISTLNSASVRSKPAIITVKYPPIPSRTRQLKDLTLIRGSPGTCPCLLDAHPAIQSVSWYRNGVSIRIEPKGGAYSINAEYSLVIKSVSIADNGEYICRAQNSEGFGQESQPIHIETKEAIKFSIKPESIYHVNEREELTVPCVAFGHPQPQIKWFKNAAELPDVKGNLTIESIDKTDHGSYICQASNEHTTTNMTTFIAVENTTPQAPHHIQYQQIASNLHLSWEAGYDGGRPQHFHLWYRLLHARKRAWIAIRVMPNNATEFTLFDLKLQQIYELTLVAENDFGLGTFTPIQLIELNNTHNASMDYLYHSKPNKSSRPLSPANLHLSQSGSNLHIKWTHPKSTAPSARIVSYVIQWRSTILFNNQQSQQSVILPYPSQSYLLKDVKDSKYVVQMIAYSESGSYSVPIESQIDIQLNAILAYSGSSRFLILLFSILIALTAGSMCICLFCLYKYYYYRRSYCTDRECDSKEQCLCCCFPPLQYKLGDCSHLKAERYHASLLKSNDLPSTPLFVSSKPSAPLRSSSPQGSFTDSTISLAKVTTIPRCRDSIVSTAMAAPQLKRGSLLIDHLQVTATASDDAKMLSFFEPNAMGTISPVPYADADVRKNAGRLPLEVVPEMNELDVANSRYSFDPTLPLPHHSQLVQPSPVLITFDSSSLKRRT